MKDEPYFYHPLENIEDIEQFENAVKRGSLVQRISENRPYTYWTLECYDQENGIRGGGGLGILAADMRRIAEQMEIPFVLVTPFYPYEVRQVIENGALREQRIKVDYHEYGYRKVDSVFIRCNGELCNLEVIEKKLGDTHIIAVTEENFGQLYQDTSGSDHRLYQEVSLGFGGYKALKLVGLKPSVIQLNEVATFFAALARLDELCSNGMDFYEAFVYTRKHTIYTNHTLVQAAEAEFSREQFERFVYPNLKSPAVCKWLSDRFVDDKIKISTVAVEIAELKNGVSTLHARVAKYRDIVGERVKFKPITNGIDMAKWVLPETLRFYTENGILDDLLAPSDDFEVHLSSLSAEKIRELKSKGREILNEVLFSRPDQNGKILNFTDEDFIFDFKRRFVDYKRPELPFTDLARLRAVLEPRNAHYILAGRVHTGDAQMMTKLVRILNAVQRDSYLSSHVHYLVDYDERLAYALSVGSNTAINVPIVGLEACGTSWMKDVANLNLLISTIDGGVADVDAKYCLAVTGDVVEEEVQNLYKWMGKAIQIWENDFDLEYKMREQLTGYLPIISGARMMADYLSYIFPE